METVTEQPTRQLSDAAIQLLREVEVEIGKHPDKYDQFAWVDDEKGDTPPTLEAFLASFNNCKTTACIAGWCCLLRLDSPQVKKIYESGLSYYFDDAAIDLLGTDAARRLFSIDCWPIQFWTDDDPVTAEQAIARIEHFIATDGRE